MDGETNVLTELYNALDQQPSSIYVHERLLEVWQGLGEEGMACGIASALLYIDPTNGAATRYLQSRRDRVPEKAPYAGDLELGYSRTTREDPLSAEKILEEGYASLKLEGKLLREEIEAVRVLGRILTEDEETISNLQAISDGRVSTAVPLPQPLSVREVARVVMTMPKRCQELIVEDFETVVRWATCQSPPLGPDGIREKLVKRKTLLEAALPESMQHFPAAALTHIEREYLQKKYVNSETMLGDKIEDILKENFFVSEDNYAWDMEELAQALVSNDGVMRNPLSREMFPESDIRKILTHPLGRRLKLLQLEQSQLREGVRPMTIDWVEKLGRIMLADQSVDTAPSRQAMDEFIAYAATLPESERKTINSLKIPATDGYSGQSFDYTIGCDLPSMPVVGTKRKNIRGETVEGKTGLSIRTIDLSQVVE
ncbi:hypothetical protein FGG08_005913 [Glutinoglossum americanum]|uniref:Uncharacterized protein n=1 Tax=Glutinoglossum americanum TaxID=1670608 RepID=A0A9P8HTN6_9PEZI|nr:hypothetical protein FGG08_005913 [Glutinoglossum americanum]